MKIALLDTNVLASGIVGYRIPASTTGQLLRAWRSGEFQLVLSEHVLVELEHTLRAPYFSRRLTNAEASEALALLVEEGTLTPLTFVVHGVATHPEDDLILATAVSANADYLVTGDGQLQRLGSYEGVAIVTPREFLEVMDRETRQER